MKKFLHTGFTSVMTAALLVGLGDSSAALAQQVSATLPVVSKALWYHADYVTPSWGRRLGRVEKIGAHIFYRA